jgi:hypothetical protein
MSSLLEPLEPPVALLPPDPQPANKPIATAALRNVLDLLIWIPSGYAD